MGLIDETAEAYLAEQAAKAARQATAKAKRTRSAKFRSSLAWRRIRYKVLAQNNGRCQACGRSKKDGAVMHVDHIEPISKCWERRLDITNLQLLCDDCNIGKLNLSTEDWR